MKKKLLCLILYLLLRKEYLHDATNPVNTLFSGVTVKVGAIFLSYENKSIITSKYLSCIIR